MNEIKNVCVYCASSTQIPNIYFKTAEHLGELLAQQGINLIDGAGQQGLMGCINNAILASGGTVTGIIPHFMVEQGWHHPHLTQLIETETMHERKQMMVSMSDGIIALPGGCGTMEELLEAITWKQLGLYLKPIVILNTANFYNPLFTLLQQAERMIDNRQYRDALSLCELIHIYCQPGFPIQYLSYREDLIENRSHQGIYDSYCEVAQKAFRQTQYQLAGQYALLAHQYYTENETHMSGINQALELLDRISDCYYRFAQESDTTERAYYMALIDSIAHKTGIPLYLEEDYDPAQDIAADLQLLDPGTKPESIAVPAFVPLNIDSILPDGKPLNSRQAQQYFDQAYEQANYFRSKRDFAEAQRWFELAKKLKEKHGYLRTGPDFSELYRQNLLQSMEQMLNKAVYYLWTTEIAQSEELQQQALELFASYQIEEPEDATTLTKLQLMLDNYQLAQQSLESLRQVARKYSLPEYASCSLPEKQMRKAENLFERWTAYNDSLNQAEAYLAAGDTLRFIQCYLNADSTFNRIGLAEYIPSAPSLFSRLSATRQFSILLLWAKNCVEQGDLDQARFIAGYLSAIGYSRPDIEKTQRTLKKKQGQEKRGGRP